MTQVQRVPKMRDWPDARPRAAVVRLEGIAIADVRNAENASLLSEEPHAKAGELLIHSDTMVF